MHLNWRYAIFTGVFIGILGGLVFFVWDMINHSFSISHALGAAIPALIIFGIIGFVLGLLTGNLEKGF